MCLFFYQNNLQYALTLTNSFQNVTCTFLSVVFEGEITSKEITDVAEMFCLSFAIYEWKCLELFAHSVYNKKSETKLTADTQQTQTKGQKRIYLFK